MERVAARAYDAVIIAHERRVAQLGFTSAKVHVIYNVPGELEWNKRRPVLGVPVQPYFAYIGSLSSGRGVEILIRAAQKARVRLVVGGYGPGATGYGALAAMYSDVVTFVGRVPYEEVLVWEASARAVLGLYDPAVPNNRLAAPNKLFEAMFLGRPFVTNREVLCGEIVETEGIGLAVPYGEVNALAEALRRLAADEKAVRDMGARARQLYEKRYSQVQQRQRLLGVYRQILCLERAE